MMKFYIATIVTLIFLSSCLKQSIADAMLDKKSGGRVTATMSYAVNGDPVNISVENAGNQNPNSFRLGCIKYPGYYSFEGVASTGDLSFSFPTDTLTTGSYEYGAYARELYFMSYNGQAEFIYGPTDNMKFTVTSHSNGYISGTFSGQLTPMVSSGPVGNSYGDPGSILITNGSFANVPVFY